MHAGRVDALSKQKHRRSEALLRGKQPRKGQLGQQRHQSLGTTRGLRDRRRRRSYLITRGDEVAETVSAAETSPRSNPEEWRLISRLGDRGGGDYNRIADMRILSSSPPPSLDSADSATD
uniref:Uncharacterized protein n=1 Tax=Steinernema glaseri TaxID=37863 RepID=A0A1I7Y890_9BILA